MRVSKEWLGQYITLPDSVTADDLANDITLKSVEVEDVISYAALLDNIVLAEITTIEKHSNADSLYCCAVDNGSGESVPIVCGGGNLREGMRVILGMVGAKVQWHGEGDLVELKKTKIRGEVSHGMICAAEEIGLALLFPQKDEKDIEKSAKTALLSCLSKIPFLKVIDVQESYGDKDFQPFDIKVKIRLTGKAINLIAEVKSSGQPRLAREAVNQMLRFKDKVSDAYFVFIAPYISPSANQKVSDISICPVTV